MSENEITYEVAAERFDRALSRLEASVRSLNGRVRAHARIEADTQKLMAERARFASDLDKVSARAKRLDDTAADVARRLVVAMETVNEVLKDA
jgi:cytochrome c556